MLGRGGGAARAYHASSAPGHGRRPRAAQETRAIVHKAPSVPIMLDGEKAASEAVKDFDGKPLYYFLSRQSQDDGTLRVFSTAAGLHAYRREIAASVAPLMAPDSAGAMRLESATESSVFSGAVALYEHEYFGGDRWVFNGEDGSIPHFGKVFCFLWMCEDINDKVTSLTSNIWVTIPGWVWPVYTVLYEHINYEGVEYGGSELWIPNSDAIPTLVPSGWNDRVSSMSYFTSNY